MNTSQSESNDAARVPIFDRVLFVALTAILCARPLISESFTRAALSFLPAQIAGGITPATTVWLDTLLLLAAVLVVARYWRRPARPVVIAALGLLLVAVVASVASAGDKRQAANAGAHLFVMALAGVALVRVLRARWMAHVLLAALLAGGVANAVKCGTQQAYELDDSLAYWEQQKEALLANGVDVDSPTIVNYERRLRAREPFGYLFHPNVTGSYLAMCVVIAAGILIGVLRKPELTLGQRVAATLIAALLAYRLLSGLGLTGSMGAEVAQWVATGLLVLLGLGHRWVAAHRRGVIVLLAGAYVGVIAAGAAYGLLKGTLPHTSLAFRWQYWQAAGRAYADQPLSGVGRENFRAAYLLYKPPESTEEVNNPHNLWLTLLVELGPAGLIAGVLLIGVTLCGAVGAFAPSGRSPPHRAGIGTMLVAAIVVLLICTLLRWTMLAELHAFSLVLGTFLIAITLSVTIRAFKQAGHPAPARADVATMAVAAVGVLVIQAIFSGEQFGAPGILILWLAYLAGVWLLGFTLAYSVVALADERRHVSHWLAAGLTAALYAALIHNLIGVALFTPAGLAVFVGLAACAMALRSPESPPPAASTVRAPVARSTVLVIASVLLVVAYGWLVVWPTFRVQGVRDRVISRLQSAASPDDAYTGLVQARRWIALDRWNADLPLTLARLALDHGRQPALSARRRDELLTLAESYAQAARKMDPRAFAIESVLAEIRSAVAGASGDVDDLRAAARQWQAALALYPTRPRAQISAGRAAFLAWQAGQEVEYARQAVAAYRAALAVDATREPEVAAKLRPTELEDIRRALDALRAAGLD